MADNELHALTHSTVEKSDDLNIFELKRILSILKQQKKHKEYYESILSTLDGTLREDINDILFKLCEQITHLEDWIKSNPSLKLDSLKLEINEWLVTEGLRSICQNQVILEQGQIPIFTSPNIQGPFYPIESEVIVSTASLDYTILFERIKEAEQKIIDSFKTYYGYPEDVKKESSRLHLYLRKFKDGTTFDISYVYPYKGNGIYDTSKEPIGFYFIECIALVHEPENIALNVYNGLEIGSYFCKPKLKDGLAHE